MLGVSSVYSSIDIHASAGDQISARSPGACKRISTLACRDSSTSLPDLPNFKQSPFQFSSIQHVL